MAYVDIDGHKKQSQMCLLTAGGEILPQCIPTQWEECAVVCAKRPTARISEWSGGSREARARPAARRRTTFFAAGQAPPHGVEYRRWGGARGRAAR
jgi:hypothetical protein